MLGYVSIAELTSVVRSNLHRIPGDVDLIVGIPRSGMIPAYLVGLYMNRLVVDLETFLANGIAGHGLTREPGEELTHPQAARHVLLIDDSLSSGASLHASRRRIAASTYSGKVTTCIAIGHPARQREADVSFVELPQPRIFEWNAFHHPEVGNACFDLDGILCVDPTDAQNDDATHYREFLRMARPLFRPSRPLGHIVSARLEKYRTLTEDWLAEQGISYGQLHLIDLPSHVERRRRGAHIIHKARVYRETDAFLFYESDPLQAREIARLAGRPVLCTADMSLQLPGPLNLSAATKRVKWHLKKPLGHIKSWWRQRSMTASPSHDGQLR